MQDEKKHSKTDLDQMAARLKTARFSLGYSQRSLADKVGVSAAIIGQYESGNKIPGGSVLAGFCSIGIDATWLLTGKKTKIDGQLFQTLFDRVRIALGHMGMVSFSSQAVSLVVFLYDEISSGSLLLENVEERIEQLSKIMLPSSPCGLPPGSDSEEAGEIGKRLRVARGALSREEIAARLGVHLNTYGNYERGARLPDSGFLQVFCRELKINPSWLLLGEGPKDRQ